MTRFPQEGLRALTVSVLAACALLACSMTAQASAGDPAPSGPLPTAAPATPLHGFAKGRIGVLDSTFQRAYLVAAWRVLDNAPLSDPEIDMLSRALQGRTTYATENPKGEHPWPDARKRYGGATNDVYISSDTLFSFKKLPGLDDPQVAENDYLAYANCNFAATETAATTLASRATQYGDAMHNSWVKEWLVGQDQVFETCSSGVYVEPAAASNDAPQWFKFDRQYQRAAALMYAGRFADARTAFDAIAHEPRSPWAALAPYLAARVMLRQASLTATPALRAERLERARQSFEQLRQHGTPDQRRQARSMLGRIAVMANPTAALVTASERVGSKRWDAETPEQLSNLLSLVRQDNAFGPIAVKSDGALADWLQAIGAVNPINPAGGPWDPDHSDIVALPPAKVVELCGSARGAEHKAAWTVACLAGANRRAEVPPALWNYAAALTPTHPAYATLSYHLARLQMEDLTDEQPKQVAALRAQLERQLALGTAVFGEDGLNALRLLRTRLATSLREAVRLATLPKLSEPAAYAWYSEQARTVGPELELHPIVIDYALYGMSVTELTQAVVQPNTVPTELRTQWLGMTWLRAVLLGQTQQEAILKPLLVKAVPALQLGLATFAAAQDPVVKQFELAHLMLQFGELDIERLTRQEGHWGRARAAEVQGYRTFRPSAMALAERERLAPIGTYTDFVGRAVVAYAQRKPNDPRLVEDLATVVRLTRFEYSEEPNLSKRAFTLLHKLYPESAAARRTRYWY